jgi:hypothetical protein
VNPRRALVLAAVVLPFVVAAAEDRKLSIVFTGDNGGEIAPCG